MNKSRGRWLLIGTLSAIILVVGVPFIINECYKKNDGYITVWNAADLLSYYGTIVAAGIGIVGVYFTVYIANKNYRDDAKNRILPYIAINVINVRQPDPFSEGMGLEGIMVFGAFAGIMFIRSASAAMPSWLVLLIAILISILAGILLSALHAFASIHLKAEQTISSTAIITFATAFCIFYARVMLGTEQVVFRNTFRIDAVPLLSKIPVLGPILFQKAYVTTYLGILVLIVTAFILKRTRFGLRLRSCGENPQAADSVGISVYKMRYSGVLISGALAGLGGLVFILPTTTTYTASVSGYGFLAMSVVVFGQWKPWGIALGALFFGLTKTIAASYSVIPFLYNLGIPEAFFKMLPYVATLIVLAFSTKRSNAPGVIGVPYDKSKR